MADDNNPPKPPQEPVPADRVLDAPGGNKPGEPYDPNRGTSRKLVTAGLIVSIISFVGGWIPFLGYAGVVGVILALLGRSGAPREERGKVVGAVILGVIGLGAGIVWTAAAIAFAKSSCPHVYAWDGSAWRLDADMVSGALFQGAEADDVDRLEYLKESDGRYLVRVINERQERDFVDRLALEVVDHPAGTTALPTPAGEIALLGELHEPIAARDGFGRDQLALLRAEDDRAWQGSPADHDPDKETHPRDTLEVTLPVQGESAFLVLRARNTEVATEALYRYLGEMGPGVADLLQLAETSESYPYRQRLADEMDRLGVPLQIEIKSAGAWSPVLKLHPIGPATPRYLAIALPAKPEQSTVAVRLTAVPAAWEIDRVAIAPASRGQSTQLLSPVSARGSSGSDLAKQLLAADGDRVRLDQGQHVDVAFAAPAAPSGATRSLFLRMRGYYEPPIGGHGWLNPIALARHHLEPDAGPRFFLRTLRKAD